VIEPKKCTKCQCPATNAKHPWCSHCRKRNPCPRARFAGNSAGNGHVVTGTVSARPAAANDGVLLVPVAPYNPFPNGAPK
jgi:hypothetical protein